MSDWLGQVVYQIQCQMFCRRVFDIHRWNSRVPIQLIEGTLVPRNIAVDEAEQTFLFALFEREIPSLAFFGLGRCHP